MERLGQFLPSILIIFGIAALTSIYLKLIIKRLGQSLKSVEWHQKNKWKVSFLIGIPIENILAPTAEELIFRAPLIVIFGAISSWAWIGILISSVVFAAVHWFGSKVKITDIFFKKEMGAVKTDSVEAEIAQIEKTDKKEMRMRRIAQVAATFLLGILAGFFGIQYQSIWVSVGIHAMWNLFVPLILLIMIFLFLGVASLWHKIRWSRK